MKVRTAGVEPAISCSRSTRNTRLSHVLSIESAQRELNPHFRHGKAAGCRYIMGANVVCRIVKEPLRSTGRDSNPRRRITGAVSLPLDDQCLLSVGSEGLEPSPGGLRVRCAAASTLIPCSPFLTRREWARRESNPQSDPYKRPALTVELRAVTASGAEGT